MVTCFDLNTPHSITAANYMTFPTGITHPDRVLDAHDFIYITAGEWEILQDGVCLHAVPGDVVILTAGAHHWGERPCADGTGTMCFHVIGLASEQLLPEEESISGIPLGPIIHCGEHPEVQRLFFRIAETFNLCKSHREEWLSVLFAELVLSIRDAEQQIENAGTELVRDVNRLILSEPGRFFSNRELAARFRICERTFVSRFQTQAGTTPHRYQLQRKLQSIRALLDSNPELTLRALAEIFGFYDEFHLSRAFKREFGVSPGDFKKRKSGTAAG